MGKQVNFFMLGSDETALMDHIVKCNGVVMQSRSDTAKIAVLDGMPQIDEAESRQLCITPDGRSKEVTIEYFATIQKYIVNEQLSPVIQLNRCEVEPGILHRGRIWTDLDYPVSIPGYGVVRGEYKGKDLEALFNCLARWIWRAWKRDPIFGFYCGPEALRFYENGGELSQM